MADPDVVNTGFDPLFGGPLAQFRAALAKQGVNTNLISGVRSNQEQQELYANWQAGRAGQPLPFPKHGPVPLAAVPGTSIHERGLAADVQPVNRADLPKMYALAGQYGLQPLGAKDPYHFQLADWRTAEANQAAPTPWNTLSNQPSQYASNIADASAPNAGGGFVIPGTTITVGGGAPTPGALSRPSTPTPGTSAGDYYHTTMMHESGGKNTSAGNGGAYYQFEPSTWATLRAAHPELNLPEKPTGADLDTQTAAMKAFTQGNIEALQKANIPINDKNAYMAHFLGAGGATKFLGAMGQNADASAVDLFPTEAKANPSVFYADGKPRTLQQVYDAQTAKQGSGNTTGFGPDAEPGVPGTPAAANQAAADNQSWFGKFTQGPINPATGKPDPNAKTPMAQIGEALLNNTKNTQAKVDAAGPEQTALSNMQAPMARNVSPMGGELLPSVPQNYMQRLASFARPLTYNAAPPQAPQMPAAGFQGGFGPQAPGISLNSLPVAFPGQIRPLTLDDYGYQGVGYAS